MYISPSLKRAYDLSRELPHWDIGFKGLDKKKYHLLISFQPDVRHPEKSKPEAILFGSEDSDGIDNGDGRTKQDIINFRDLVIEKYKSGRYDRKIEDCFGTFDERPELIEDDL